MTIGAQKSALATVEAILAAGAAKIEGVDKGLTPDARRERIAAIREETLEKVSDTRADMAKRGQEATAGLPHWSQDAARRRAKFSDDAAVDAQQRLALGAVLMRTATPALFEHLADAIRAKHIAHAEAVRVEFATRNADAETKANFHRTFAAVVDQQAKSMEAELSQIAGLAAHADTLIAEFARGASNPIQRMTTARAAGLAA